MLHQKKLDLDAVIELKVDEGILLKRIEKRAGEAAARGEAVRADDTAEALHKRLEAYRAQTAPLIAFYRDKGVLRTVDGMVDIDEVATAIERALGEAGGRPAEPVGQAERRSSGA
jgi:adenylate kinase